MSDKSVQEELVELRQYVDWANYRLGELERSEAERLAQAPTTAPTIAATPQPQSEPQGIAQLHQPPPIIPLSPPSQSVKLPPIEELLSPARLAWAGGVILVAGLCFLVSYGIRQGWITPEMRIALAAIVSIAIGVGGVRLRERGDLGPVPLAMTAVAIAGLFATISAADIRYDMFGSSEVALGFAFAVAATGAAVAIRWDSELLGALALIGALASPIFVEIEPSTALFPFTLAAFAATMIICAAKGWRMLLLPALLLGSGMTAACLEHASIGLTVIAWSLIWLLAQVGVTGPRLRGTYSERFSMDVGGMLMVLSAATIVATAGYFQIEPDHSDLAIAWIVALAAIHLLLAASTYLGYMRELRCAAIDVIIGATLLAIGTALIFDGPTLTIAWCLQAAVAAWFTRGDSTDGSGQQIARVSALGLIALAAFYALQHDAQGELLDDSSIGTAALLNAVASLGAIAAASAVFAWRDKTELRYLPMAIALAALTLIAALCLDGAALVCAYCVGAAAITLGTQRQFTEEGVVGSLALIALAAFHLLQFEASPNEALVTGAEDLLAAAVSLLAIAGALGAIVLRGPERLRVAASFGVGISLVYLCSAAIVHAFPPEAAAYTGTSLGDRLESGQQGQALLSAFWAIVAFASIIVGLRAQIKELRFAGLSLLMIAIGKILFIDLATLDAAYRTISFIAVGGVLLAVAFAFQRLRVADEQAEPPA